MSASAKVEQPQAKFRLDYQAPDFTITDVDLEFDLDDQHTLVQATSKVKRVSSQQDAALCLAGESLKLLSVSVNGELWSDYQHDEHELRLFHLPDEFELCIQTEINPSANTALEGLYKSGDAFCTQCEAEGFRRITYFLDRPDVLARYQTRVIADAKQYPFLLSNGNKIDEGVLTDGRHWVQWQDPHPKPSYLFALVAGDFDVLRDQFTTMNGRQVALEIFVDKGNLDRAPHAMASLQNAMKWDEERFGLEYDLDIYMIVAVDFFNMGAMENKGLNVFNSKFVLANPQTATDDDYLGVEAVIGHEYFHNWTGNRITCRDWFQLSLKEGLTVFRDQEFSSDLGDRTVNRINNVRIIRGPQFAEDASPMSHPIRPDQVIEMNNFYTLTVYEKGSEVIRMMHTLLGEEKFQAGMRLYVERHDGTAATCDDFVAAMSDASGVDLTQFKLWYSQSGTPNLMVTSSYDAQQQQFNLTVTQQTKPTADQSEKVALHIPLRIALYDQKTGAPVALMSQGQSVDPVLNVTQETQSFQFDCTSPVIVSLLDDFSAPVTLSYDYSDDDLAMLMRHATSPYARWDASQQLLAKHVRRLVADYQAGVELSLPYTVGQSFLHIIEDESLAPALIAEVMTLPSENEIAGWFDVIDVDAIAHVRRFIRACFAQHWETTLQALYHDLQPAADDFSHQAIGERCLKNNALAYLALLPANSKWVEVHFEQAGNMTDTMAAMTAANSAMLSCREQLMQSFSDRWQQDGLVMDKWFMLQGTNPAQNCLANVEAVKSHPAFDMKNPNRVRSLIGSFVNNNPVYFHALDGSGYQFLVEALIQLNTANPQVASRLIDPLLKYRRYDEPRQVLMRQALEQLAGLDNLAKDLFEKINKALDV
ncbi:Aminopeptidase N [Vibrio stylophorae]|uniref:Aminopeptidase N n=1 Tax=Vibrio stylophorae TaxID=659351 RepID=A0ABM8ZT36_9VIBR|nr:aminopeptidase N [Vibrio stylophorae]CAH0533469.1 Aminopeptidase N [Vibrio stylophorae]